MMNYVVDVARYYRAIIDETKKSFVSDALISQMLARGYDEFRSKVSDIDPTKYGVRVNLQFAGGNYDLAAGAVKIMGTPVPPLTNPRLSRILAVHEDDGMGNASRAILPAQSQEDIDSISITPMKYLLSGTTMRVSAPGYSGTIRLDYQPVSSVDWTKTAPADTEWIDDLVEFHDIIALLAVQEYCIIDGYQNPEADNLLVRRMDDLYRHLAASSRLCTQVRTVW